LPANQVLRSVVLLNFNFATAAAKRLLIRKQIQTQKMKGYEMGGNISKTQLMKNNIKNKQDFVN
jgi:hypothetical protein